MIARDYQTHAVRSVDAEYSAGRRSTLVVQATGTGKTVVFCEVARHRQQHGRCMIIAHMDALIRQAAEKVRKVIGVEPGIEKAELWAGRERVVVASRQTLISKMGRDGKRRFERFNPADFDLIVIDEAHTALCESTIDIVKHFAQSPDCKVLGVTATPERGDGQALGLMFESVASNYPLQDAVRDGWLVQPRQFNVTIPGLDYSRVGTKCGDLDEKALEAAMLIEEPLHGIVHATIEQACNLEHGTLIPLAKIEDVTARQDALRAAVDGKDKLKTLVFASGVAHAKAMTEILNRWQPRSAQYVIGQTPFDEREQIFADFHAGTIQYLVGCDVMTVGFDEPDIQLLVMARPTKSRGLFQQMIGRGTRPLESIASLLGTLPTAEGRRAMIAASRKPHCMELDFVGNAGKHSLVTSVDIFAGLDAEEAVVKRANEIIEAGEHDPVKAIELATIDIEEDQEVKRMIAEAEAVALLQQEEDRLLADAARRAGLVGTSKYSMTEVGASKGRAPEAAALPGMKRNPATEPQINYLIRLGVKAETARTYSKSQAGAVISSMKAQRERAGAA